MERTITYGQETIHYEVRFLSSRRTLGIEVHPDSRVLVRAPVDCTESLVAERVQKRAAWISRQLSEFERYHPRTPTRQYVNGESHLYLGRQYRMKLVPAEETSVKLARGLMFVRTPGVITPEQVKKLLHRWYLGRARVIFGEILNANLPSFKAVGCPRLNVRTMQSRWGSLSRADTMTLNVNLVRAPRACIEYVVVHELCHMKHRDHDGRFFRLLERMMPDWEKRKRRLEAALL